MGLFYGKGGRPPKIETVIKWFRGDTKHIIKENPSKCKIIREEPIKEDGEIVNYEKITVATENVRILNSSLDKMIGKDKVGNVATANKYLLIAEWDSKIKKDDILIDENNKTFKVENINLITHYGKEENNCYRIEGRLKLIEDN